MEEGDGNDLAEIISKLDINQSIDLIREKRREDEENIVPTISSGQQLRYGGKCNPIFVTPDSAGERPASDVHNDSICSYNGQSIAQTKLDTSLSHDSSASCDPVSDANYVDGCEIYTYTCEESASINYARDFGEHITGDETTGNTDSGGEATSVNTDYYHSTNEAIFSEPVTDIVVESNTSLQSPIDQIPLPNFGNADIPSPEVRHYEEATVHQRFFSETNSTPFSTPFSTPLSTPIQQGTLSTANSGVEAPLLLHQNVVTTTPSVTPIRHALPAESPDSELPQSRNASNQYVSFSSSSDVSPITAATITPNHSEDNFSRYTSAGLTLTPDQQDSDASLRHEEGFASEQHDNDASLRREEHFAPGTVVTEMNNTGDQHVIRISEDFHERSVVNDERQPDRDAYRSTPSSFASSDSSPDASDNEASISRSEDDPVVAAQMFLLARAQRGTAIVYDEGMTAYWDHWGNHPERPARITGIFKTLTYFGLAQRCERVQSRRATDDELTLCHGTDHINKLKSFEYFTDDELKFASAGYNSIYLCKNTYDCASLSAGCTLAVVEHVLSGKALNGAAIVRPPGHHALHDASMGFCHFNNVPIAARMAQKKFGLQRILIVDWDIHYGNGIHRMFEDDPSVLYFSIHRYDEGAFWPGAACGGNYDEVGVGAGEGFNVHVPWNKGGKSDGDYMAVFNMILMPMAYEFAPELVLVSAGFDSGVGDPLGGCCVTPAGFAQMTNMMKGLAGGKVVVVLEGGYNVRTISNSMAACVSCLLGDPCPPLEPTAACPSALESISNTICAHAKYWNCFKAYEIQDKSMLLSVTPVGTQSGKNSARNTSSRGRARAKRGSQSGSTRTPDSENNVPRMTRNRSRLVNESATSLNVSADDTAHKKTPPGTPPCGDSFVSGSDTSGSREVQKTSTPHVLTSNATTATTT